MHSQPSSSPDLPAAQYQQLQRDREARVAQLQKVHIRLGNLRLLVAIAAVAELWCYFNTRAFSAWWLLTPLVLFIAIAVFHARILHKRTQAERAADFYRKGIARIEDRWHGNGTQPTPVDISAHLYATDLDLFGPASLFELLSQARTHMGEETLAHWLLAPAAIPQIHARQAAIAELAPRLTLREDMAVIGPETDKALKAGIHPEALAQWATSPNQLRYPWLRWLTLALSLAAIATVILWITSGIKIPFLATVIVEIVLFAFLRKDVAEVSQATEHALHDLNLLSVLLKRLEQESFQSPLLQSLKQNLTTHQVLGSKAIAQLQTIVELIHSLDNPILKPFDIPLMYSVQVAYAAEAWRTAHGKAVPQWLATIGEAEALLSLAAYHFEHPADPFPDFTTGLPSFAAQSLGHPLIPGAKCVRNDIRISGETRALLISGSNMSGKSTLMRAIGLNTVLAMAGAPVRAQHLQLTPLQVGASILINDSLQEGASRFYAEITRLRHLCDLARHQPPLLFLLDELLQGTNSKDRLIGAEGVVRALLEAGSIGLISTHDLALTNLSTSNALHNVHLQDEIANGKMTFDYKLREGVVTHSNGIELMRLIGLKV